MDDTASRSGIQRLDLDNYHTWAVQVKCWLVTKGLFKHTQQTLEGEAESDAKALAFLGMTLSEQYLPMFSECEKAKEAWDAFANLFKSKSQARRLQLKSELSSLRKASGEPLLKYFARAKHLRAQLLSVGTTLPDDELTLSVLGGLPGEYETLYSVLMASDRIATLDELLPKLMVVENKTSRPASDNKALVAKPGNVSGSRFQSASQGKRGGAKEVRKCHYCGKPGHIKKDCWKRQREEQGDTNSNHIGGQGSNARGFGRSQANVACAAVQAGQGQAWMLDSGASAHITMTKSGMVNVKEVAEEKYITFGNGSRARMAAVGDVVLAVPESDFGTLTLTDVLYVPEATMNLFSVRSAVSRGIKVTFSRGQDWRVPHHDQGRQAASQRRYERRHLRHGGPHCTSGPVGQREP